MYSNSICFTRWVFTWKFSFLSKLFESSLNCKLFQKWINSKKLKYQMISWNFIRNLTRKGFSFVCYTLRNWSYWYCDKSHLRKKSIRLLISGNSSEQKMGHGFGHLWKYYGVVSYTLSPFEIKPLKGTLNPGFLNTCRRFAENVPYMGPRKLTV